MTQKNSIFHRRLNYEYPLIVRGKGVYLFDNKGRKYLDACGGALVANLGHGQKELAQNIGKLAQRFSYLHGSQFSTKEMEEYARDLCQISPKGLTRVFFVSGGSEAVESALKLARQYHFDSGNKTKYLIISRKPAYHGSTILAQSLSTRKVQRRHYLPYLFRFPVIAAPFCYHCPLGKNYPQCGIACAKELEVAIKKAGPEKVSAFIAEPVIGASAGAVVPPKEYFPMVRKICDRYNVLLVFDEVMSGFGRTGKWFASQYFNVSPDIMTVSKGIGGGFVPLAAVFCQEKIFEAIKKGSGSFNHGFTFENNPLTTSVGRAVLKYVKKHQLVENCAKMGEYLFSRLQEFKDSDAVGDIRGLGLMTAVEFVENKKTRKPFSRKKQVAERFVQAALKKGVNLYYSIGFSDNEEGDAVMIAPPYSVTRKEIDKIIKVLKEVILNGKIFNS